MQTTQWLLDQRQGVRTVSDIKTWLAELPLLDARTAQHRLIALLTELDERAIAPGDLLPMLEALRRPVVQAQAAYSARYAGKAVPLAHSERTAYAHARTLWQAFEAAYTRAARFDWSEAKVYVGQATVRETAQQMIAQALPWQRALWCAVQRLREAPRAHRLNSAADWASALAIVQQAQAAGIVDTDIRDSHHPKGHTTIGATFVRALLGDRLTRSAQLFSASEYDAASALAERWAHRAQLLALGRPKEDEPTLDHASAAREEARRAQLLSLAVHGAEFELEIKSLRRALRALVTNPAAVAEDDQLLKALPQGLAEKLESAWLPPTPQHQFNQIKRARAAKAVSAISAQFAAAHQIEQAMLQRGLPLAGEGAALVAVALDASACTLLATGAPFAVPLHARSQYEYTRQEAERLFVFQHGDALGAAQRATDTAELTARYESWQARSGWRREEAQSIIVYQEASAHSSKESIQIMLLRPLDQAGTRVRVGQFIAFSVVNPLQPAATPCVGLVRWTCEHDELALDLDDPTTRAATDSAPHLELGIELFTQSTLGIALQTGKPNQPSQWLPAYQLDPTPIIGQAHLLIPAGLAQIGSTLTWADAQGKHQATVHAIIERSAERGAPGAMDQVMVTQHRG